MLPWDLSIVFAYDHICTSSLLEISAGGDVPGLCAGEKGKSE